MLKLTREHLEDEKTYCYALLCDGHVIDFKKDPKEHDYVGVCSSRIVFVDDTPEQNDRIEKGEIELIRTDIKETI